MIDGMTLACVCVCTYSAHMFACVHARSTPDFIFIQILAHPPLSHVHTDRSLDFTFFGMNLVDC